jgi:hypothetical protein
MRLYANQDQLVTYRIEIAEGIETGAAIAPGNSIQEEEIKLCTDDAGI